MEVTANLLLERNNMPELHAEKTQKLAPGEKQRVALDLVGDLQTAHFKLHASGQIRRMARRFFMIA